MGSISGFNRITIGEPTVSGHAGFTKSSMLFISIVAESKFTSLLNSKITMEEFSLDIELTFFILLTVATACSIGFVTTNSTSSGLAPG